MIQDVELPFPGIDGVQVTYYKVEGRGWTLVVATHRPAGAWEVRVRYERLATPELGDVVLQELGRLEDEL